MTYSFIEENQHRYDISDMCDALDVSRAGYYQWRNRAPSSRSLEDEAIKQRIAFYHDKSLGSFGYRMIHDYLGDEQVDCGRDRTLRPMRALSIERCLIVMVWFRV
ncbi:IS3 family transposase [Puniceicoccaceae bacterium K14]|nr:IS3 family transposase [Puniceicoccaceae bacterium K14]